MPYKFLTEKGSDGNKFRKGEVSSCARKWRGYAGGGGALPEERPDRGRLPGKGCPEEKWHAGGCPPGYT